MAQYGHRIAVISDIHSNVFAFQAALDCAHEKGFDRLVILGDLLTYGASPLEVVSLARGAVARDGAVMIKGNHDQLYFDLMDGKTSYYDKLPDWLRETVDWTQGRIGELSLAAEFPWRNDLVDGDVLLVHANPFEYGDWTYLNSLSDMSAARMALMRRGQRFGVFGHTHRAAVVQCPTDDAAEFIAHDTNLAGNEVLKLSAASGEILANCGSVGQPRSTSRASTMLFFVVRGAEVEIETHRLSYDVEAHCDQLMKAAMTDATKRKLLGYFR
jgi:predicted phosphodiesterase